ncbi:H-2 class I histocompatibility antigen, Q7 alpha chain-like isoform 1-T1 [Clarias gariepinus]
MWCCSAVMKALFFLTFPLHFSSAVTHSLQYLYTAVTPGINFPEFMVVGLVDGQEFEYYDSDIRELIPKTKWMLKVIEENPETWNSHTQFQFWQKSFKNGLNMLLNFFNHSTGVHTLQWIFGCELDDDGTNRGHAQLGFDGENFLNFDLKNTTWIPDKLGAEISQQIWDYIDSFATEGRKIYLSTICIKRMKLYVSYGRETLEKKVCPEVSVFQKHSSSPEVVCHVTGFFPKAVMITWHKDREDVHEDVELRQTLPNQDGSFQKRSILKVPAEELQKHNYTCMVQHSSLEKELVLHVSRIMRVCCVLIDGGSGGAPIAIITAVVAALIALVAVVAGIVVWKRKNSGFRSVPPKSSSEGDSSTNNS